MDEEKKDGNILKSDIQGFDGLFADGGVPK